MQVLLYFFCNNRNSQKITEYNKKQKEKDDKILMLAAIHMEISHEEFITILKEKDEYEKMKDNLRSKNEKYDIMRLSSVKSKS